MFSQNRTIAHYDMAFFVNVECLKNRKLKGRPLLIGGQSDRAVVAACSYEARTFGIRSAMPMKLARCISPTRQKNSDWPVKVFAIVEEFGVFNIEVNWMQKVGLKQPT